MSTVALGEEPAGIDFRAYLDALQKGKKADKPAESKESKGKESKSKKGGKDDDAVLVAPDSLALIESFLTTVDKVFASSEAEIETGFSLAFHFLSDLDEKKQSVVVPKLTAALADKPSQAGLIKLQLLTSLFSDSVFDGSAALARLRYPVLIAALKVALASGNAGQIAPALGAVDSWAAEWKLQPSEMSELYLQSSNVYKAAGQIAEHTDLVVKYLRSIDKAPTATIAGAKDIAVAAAVTCLQLGLAQKCDVLLELAAIKQLEKDKQHANVHRLLRIFALENVESLIKFNAEQKGFLASIQLDQEATLKNMRTLTICSLGADAARIPYATLRQRLQLADNGAVEATVIDAVMDGRVEAKLDQEAEVVVIQRVTPRGFTGGAESWKQLSAKLSDWHRNVSGVLHSLHQSRSVRPDGEDGAEDQ